MSTPPEALSQRVAEALRDQGSRVPEGLRRAVQDLATAASGTAAQSLAQATAAVLLQQAGWGLHAGVPRWDSSSPQDDPHAPWGSLWMGEIDGLWQLWQRTAQEGWHPLQGSAPPPVAVPLAATSGWLLQPQGLPQTGGEGATYWQWVFALLRGRTGGILVASSLVNVGLVVLPLFAMLVYDKVVYNGVFETLWALSLGVVLWLALEITVRLLRARQVERLAVVLDERVDRHLFASLLQPTGRAGSQPGMAARFLTLYRDLAGARDFFSASYLLALADLPFVLLIWVLIGVIGWPLLLVAMAWTLVYVVLGSHLKTRTMQASQAVTRSHMGKQAVLTDALSSLDVLRTSHAGGKLFQRFMRLAREQSVQNAWLRHETLQQAHLTQVVYTGSYVSLLFTGAYLVFDQTITSGALVAVSMLSGRTLGVIGLALQTLGRWHELQNALGALTPYLQIPSAPGPDAIRRQPSHIEGRMGLVQLAHRYGQGAPVLHALNLHIAPGERLGLMGRPGSGKSTLARVLAGAILPSGGEVRVDDVSLLAYDAADRALWLAFKPQDPTLVAGTIEGNILLGLPDTALPAERMAALKRGMYYSGLDQDLKAGALSLSQAVEEYGANLSGGQRQKVALARALALPARVLILDEPTNGLDPESEKWLATRLAELQGVTLVLVTHSARMLGLTQRVLVLDQGRLVADGLTSALVKPSP